MLDDLSHGPVLEASGPRLLAVADLPASGVAEVQTEEHGVLAVGLADGVPFAVSNLCRHQFAKLGRGQVSGGCLECPWHRARYDVHTGEMREGPKGRLFGIPPYSATIKTAVNTAFKLRTFPVVIRDGAIELA